TSKFYSSSMSSSCNSSGNCLIGYQSQATQCQIMIFEIFIPASTVTNFFSPSESSSTTLNMRFILSIFIMNPSVHPISDGECPDPITLIFLLCSFANFIIYKGYIIYNCDCDV